MVTLGLSARTLNDVIANNAVKIFFITVIFYFETNIFIFTDGTPPINIYATFTPFNYACSDDASGRNNIRRTRCFMIMFLV